VIKRVATLAAAKLSHSVNPYKNHPLIKQAGCPAAKQKVTNELAASVIRIVRNFPDTPRRIGREKWANEKIRRVGVGVGVGVDVDGEGGGERERGWHKGATARGY
jgi:hypothetical protein